MLGLWLKRKPQELRPPTYALIDGFQTSSDRFYQAIEDEVNARKVPGLDFHRIDFREGGLLSGKRDYLRLRRERLTFDICSAPFGTSWFFSYRFSEIPAPLFPIELILLLVVIGALVFHYIFLFGFISGGVLIGLTIISLLLILRNTLTLGLEDFDAWLLTVPIVGRIYELLIRKDTMFRQDTRAMYVEMMERVIREKITACTAEAGIEQVTFIEAQPDIHPWFQRRFTQPLLHRALAHVVSGSDE